MWRPENSNDGISIPWTCVSLHAITSEPVRSIYMQLDFRLKWPGVYDGVKPAVAQNGNGNGLNGMAGQPGEDEDEDVDEGNVSGEYGAGRVACAGNRFTVDYPVPLDSSEDVVATEIHIIPQDENDINQIYYAMNHCQTMNPDPDESISEDDADGEYSILLLVCCLYCTRVLNLYDLVSEDFMEAEGDESDDAGHGEMRNLNLNDDAADQFADD